MNAPQTQSEDVKPASKKDWIEKAIVTATALVTVTVTVINRIG